MTLNEAIEKMNELEKAFYALNHAQSVLYTDGDTVAPKNSWKGRGKALVGSFAKSMVSASKVPVMSIVPRNAYNVVFKLPAS